MKINSKEYWDNRFATNWIEFNGKVQTRNFMNLILDYLPEDIELDGLTILDWGCALGQGVEVLSTEFKNSEVSGLDFSESAINQCLELYPLIDFFCGRLEDFKVKYDVIITSNCLEHFTDPFVWLNSILEHTNKYAIVLVPYNDEEYLNENSEHKFKFTDGSFPNQIYDFNKIEEIVITDCPGCWNGEQILVVYEKG